MELDTIVCGHALDIMPEILDGQVHCSVTSPPYYGLRKYAGEQKCDWPKVEYAPMPGLPPIRIEAMTCALGHEPTVEAYIGHLVLVYREMWRVLRDDGVAWVVMGDSYATTPTGNRGTKSSLHGAQTSERYKGTLDKYVEQKCQRVPIPSCLRQGDLMLVPHRLALALQADGWTVRNDVVWAKKAPMPESVAGWRFQRHRIKVKKSDRATNPYQSGAGTRQGAGVASRAQREAYYEQGKGAPKWIDCPGCPKCEPDGYVLRRGSWRHTRAHEFVFMLTKGMGYWSDQEQVREPNQMKPQRRLKQRNSERDKAMRDDKKYLYELRDELGREGNKSGRNPRSVVSPKPEPSALKHFATFPTSLIEPFIRATCPTRCCPECGRGWSACIKSKNVIEYALRHDITEKERQYVLSELEKEENQI